MDKVESMSEFPKAGPVSVIVEWGYDLHEIVLTKRNWSLILRGKPLRIRSRGYYEGACQWEYWNFAGGLDGALLVEYGENGAVGFEGHLKDAIVKATE